MSVDVKLTLLVVIFITSRGQNEKFINKLKLQPRLCFLWPAMFGFVWKNCWDIP